MGIKTGLKFINQFLKDYALVLIIVLAAGIYFTSNNHSIQPRPLAKVMSQTASYGGLPMEESMEMNADMAYSQAPSMVSRTKMAVSDSIQPPTALAQDFDPEGLDDRKIVKNGSLQLEVEDTEESLGLVEAELATQKAYITHQNSWEVRRGTLAYNLTIRVPADNLETLSENLEQLGLKKSENYSTADITAQYRDTGNRIKNLEVRRDRLRALMERETENIRDVLEIDRELTRVQDEIDNLSNTQTRRDTDVAYSTLQLTVSPQPEIGDFSSPDWNLENSWKSAVNDFIHDARDVVDKLIRAFVYTPIWLPLLLILWGLKRLMFGGKKKAPKTKK